MENNSISLQQFTNHPEVVKALSDLRTHFSAHNQLLVSDIYIKADDEKKTQELQFVNLVQEGGGVLGVGLIGYTWLLEEMGIRFYSLAGTSAGAINTMLLAALGRPEEKKSEKILEELCQKDFFDFVDGTRLVKVLIKNIFTRTNYIADIKKKLTLLFGAGIFIPLIGVLILSLCNLQDEKTFTLKFVLAGLTILVWTIIIALFIVLKTLNNKFYSSGYGINPGKTFYDWINSILQKYGADTMTSLYNKMLIKPDEEDGKNVAKHLNLDLRKSGNDDTRDLEDLPRKLAIVTSDITIQNKIEFPDMAGLYWDDVNAVCPAHFVRASMSIPVFFEAYQVTIPSQSKKVQDAWKEFQNCNSPDIPTYARFIDGGMISNFPINIFHNPNQKIARLPTFGIRLDDLSDELKHKVQFDQTEQQFKSFGEYIWSMFNTVRYYYDKDFLLKHRLYNNSIGKINTENFNWLNFNLTDDEKIRLFVRGVKAAKDFLINFKWEEYKANRKEILNTIKGKDKK
ncbi:MAG: patatin-like phospholipase family protein [Bacteroidota bacterium]